MSKYSDGFCSPHFLLVIVQLSTMTMYYFHYQKNHQMKIKTDDNLKFYYIREITLVLYLMNCWGSLHIFSANLNLHFLFDVIFCNRLGTTLNIHTAF